MISSQSSGWISDQIDFSFRSNNLSMVSVNDRVVGICFLLSSLTVSRRDRVYGLLLLADWRAYFLSLPGWEEKPAVAGNCYSFKPGESDEWDNPYDWLPWQFHARRSRVFIRITSLIRHHVTSQSRAVDDVLHSNAHLSIYCMCCRSCAKLPTSRRPVPTATLRGRLQSRPSSSRHSIDEQSGPA